MAGNMLGALGLILGRPILRTTLTNGTGTYNKISATNIVLAFVQGAGASGVVGGGNASGGGAGAFAIGLCIDNVASHPYVVGAGGASVAGSVGNHGGFSRFESYLAEGGFAPQAGAQAGGGGVGGWQTLDVSYLQASLLYAIGGGRGGARNGSLEAGWAPGWNPSPGSNTGNVLSAYLGRLGNGRGLAGANGSGGGDSVLGAGGAGGGAAGGNGGIGAGGGGGSATSGAGGSGRIIVFEYPGV